jgi:hypothetical protein
MVQAVVAPPVPVVTVGRRSWNIFREEKTNENRNEEVGDVLTYAAIDVGPVRLFRANTKRSGAGTSEISVLYQRPLR